MSATALLIKSLVREHAEAHPAGQDKGSRCRDLYDMLLTEFGHDRLGQFSPDEIQPVRLWLKHEKVLEARAGVDTYILAVEELRKAAAPIMREAVRRWNPAGLPAHDAMAGMLSGGLLDAVHDLRRGKETAEWTAVGLLNLARCLAHDRREEEAAA